MTRRFLVVTVCLAATVAFLVGLIVAGSMTPTPGAICADSPTCAPRYVRRQLTTLGPAAASFADIAEQLNPAVVNIDATSRAGSASASARPGLPLPDSPDLFGRAAGARASKDHGAAPEPDSSSIPTATS